MFQRGTGERFSYKKASLEKFKTAKCERVDIAYGEYIRPLYAIMVDGKRKSDAKHRAEDAWADFWINHVKTGELKSKESGV